MFGFSKKKQSEITKTAKNGGHILSDSKAILDAIDDGVIAINNAGQIELINPAAQNLTGWSQTDAFGLNFETVINLVNTNGTDLLPQENPIKKTLANPRAMTSREYFIKTQGGKIVPIFIHINPIEKSNSGFVVVFRNISKELQENREQAEFISTASHEMRTPVASIEGYLGLALNPATATIDNRAKSYLEKAHENVKHLGQLFQDLLDITRAEDGRLKNEPVVLDAVEFAREVWDGLRTKAEDKNLNYTFALDAKKSGEKTLAPVFFIHADRDHLREILNNLFENAIKYTPAGNVEVNVSGAGDWAEITVSDSGIGIPSEDLPHLFQKFYRVDNSATREIGGTGLGLYLSRRLAESLGGILTVSSEFQKGSVFTLRLPRISRERAEILKQKEAVKSDFQQKASENLADFDPHFEAESLKVEEKPAEIEAPRGENFEIPVAQNHEILPKFEAPVLENFQAEIAQPILNDFEVQVQNSRPIVPSSPTIPSPENQISAQPQLAPNFEPKAPIQPQTPEPSADLEFLRQSENLLSNLEANYHNYLPLPPQNPQATNPQTMPAQTAQPAQITPQQILQNQQFNTNPPVAQNNFQPAQQMSPPNQPIRQVPQFQQNSIQPTPNPQMAQMRPPAQIQPASRSGGIGQIQPPNLTPEQIQALRAQYLQQFNQR